MTNRLTRRFVLNTLFGASGISLRAFATGIPASVLLSPLRAFPQSCGTQAQYLLFSTSSAGDPLNANVPGTYLDPGIGHSADPTMQKTSLTLRGKTFDAALPWSTLPQSVLDRTAFFHHTTRTNNHANEKKVLQLQGGVTRQEMLVSFLSKKLSECFQTVQREPAMVGATNPLEVVSYESRTLANLRPTALKQLLTNGATPLDNLRTLRDRDLDRLNAIYKKEGTVEQRTMLDRLAMSQSGLRMISQSLLDGLSTIANDGVEGQIAAALTLFRLNVTPVVTMRLDFGGDNHNDEDLVNEAAKTVLSLSQINQLMQLLSNYGLQDKVTFAAMNVFGRTLNATRAATGRDHSSTHHCTVVIGKGIAGGVIGSVVKKSTDYSATGMNSQTGEGTDTGDIKFDDTLTSVGKTLGVAVGVSETDLNESIVTGKVIRAALA